ncbi:MAG: vWA domain-containing protein [Bacteroidota bacterium]
MTFAHPEFFLLFLLLIPVVAWYIIKQKKRYAGISISTTLPFKSKRNTFRNVLKHVLFAFRMIALSLLITALARPQSTDRWQEVSTEGIDIMIAMDISTSMLAMDFKPNRLEASKDVAIEFIAGREDDRIGLVVFAGESFNQCPLTPDHAVLINLFKDVKTGLIEDGTAIGMGLATAVNRLKDSKTKSKIIILLTDGENNRGEIDPSTAADLANTFGIKVYTIGMGSDGQVPVPGRGFFGNEVVLYQEMPLDEEILKEIAGKTGGKYYHANKTDKLIEIYNEINQLEKSKIDVKHHKRINEEYFLFVLLAGIIFGLEIILRYTILKTIP